MRRFLSTVSCAAIEGRLISEFTKELVRVSRRPEIKMNPFVRGIRSRAYTKADFTDYFLKLYHMAEAFPRVLGALISICPDRDCRQMLAQNLIDEEGFVP